MHLALDFGFPVSNHSKVVLRFAHSDLDNEYYQTNTFSRIDVADQTSFNSNSLNLRFELSSLNKKQYAFKGFHLLFQLNYVKGTENFIAGSTAPYKKDLLFDHNWVQLKFIFDKYFNPNGRYIPGIYFEGFYSTQNLFSNYTSSVLAAEPFMPIPESKTLFLSAYRANQFMAGGVKNIFVIAKNFDFRFEAYIFQAIKEIKQNEKYGAFYGKLFDNRYYMGSSSLVFHSPVGPISISVNYLQHYDQPFSFVFNFGYIIFNSKGIE